nr:hypothetical protein [Latilactobacillus sakei]
MSLLSKKRNLPRIQVGRWIQNFRLSGADALKRRRVKRSFSVEFKVDVINYYQTHDETLAEVSAKLMLILVKSVFGGQPSISMV